MSALKNQQVSKRAAVAPVTLRPERQLHQIGAAVLRLAKERGVSEAEVHIDESIQALTRFANNTIHQNVAEQDRWLSVRVRARSSNRARNNQSLRSRLDPRVPSKSALALARSAAPNSDLLPMQTNLRYFGNQTVRRRYGGATPEDRGRAVAEAIQIVEKRGQTAAGIYSTGQSVEAIFQFSRLSPPGTPKRWRSFRSLRMAADSSGWAKAIRSRLACDPFNPIALLAARRKRPNFRAIPRRFHPAVTP